MTIFLLLGLLFSDPITQETLKAHVRFLADDLLEGREATETGQKIAARYIAARFQQSGLQGLHPENEDPYYHRFDLYRGGVDPENTYLQVGATRLPQADVFRFYGYHPDAGEVQAPWVFVGYVYRSSKYKYNSLEEVEGKIVFAVDGYPAYLADKFKDTPRRREHLREQQIKWAQKAGAKALVFLHGPDVDQPDFMPESKEEANLFGNRLSTSEPKMSGTDFPVLELLSGKAQQVLGEDFAAVKDHMQRVAAAEVPATLALPERAAAVVTAFEKLALPTENVVGILPGTDPVLKNEYVVLSAHYDHLGTRDGEVFNGADDNASGTALVLELARRMAAKPTRRSLVFLALTAEEKGLIGSRVFLETEQLPLEALAADINMDMLGRNDTHSMGIIPAANEDITTLNTMIKEANASLNEPFDFDESFDRYHHRSDHYNFSRRGIPAIFLFAGDHEDYHKGSDTWDKINYEKIRQTGLLVEALLDKVGNSDERPAFTRRDPKDPVVQKASKEDEEEGGTP